jgi:pimeloyl-ACP methyl ester carboxylesterase
MRIAVLRQTRAVLDRYAANGGEYEEVVFTGTAHSPHIEKPDEFVDRLVAFLKSAE